MIIDRLNESVREKGAVCVGLDSDRSYIPLCIKGESDSVADEIFLFNKKIIDKTKDIAACYKLQIAYYEMCGLQGMKAYRDTLMYLKKENLISIGDVKRGDISKTAEAYAKAHFDGEFAADFITVNPYMGFDTIEPFLKYAERGDKGIFVLLKTSNPGSRDIELLKSQDKKVYEIIGDKICEIAKNYKGESGYSQIGFVVGGTDARETEEIRKRYPGIFFLVPGYGAQGATGEDVKFAFESGNGAVINSSRGIITAYKSQNDEEHFADYAREAVLKMRKDIGFNDGKI